MRVLLTAVLVDGILKTMNPPISAIELAKRKNNLYCISAILEKIVTVTIAIMAAMEDTLLTCPSLFPSCAVSDRLRVIEEERGTQEWKPKLQISNQGTTWIQLLTVEIPPMPMLKISRNAPANNEWGKCSIDPMTNAESKPGISRIDSNVPIWKASKVNSLTKKFLLILSPSFLY